MSTFEQMVAVSDALVHRTLEKVGRRILSEKRERHRLIGDNPPSTAHERWPLDMATALRVTAREWVEVPALLASHGSYPLGPEVISEELSEYVLETVTTGREHTPLVLADVLLEKVKELDHAAVRS